MSAARAWALLAVGLVVGAALIGFALSNEEVVEVSFLRWRLRGGAPLWAVAAAAALAGALARSALSLGGDLRRWRERRALRRRVAALEQELVRLRNLPLRDLPPLASGAAPPRRAVTPPVADARAPLAVAASDHPELLPREGDRRATPYEALFDDPDDAPEAWEDAGLYPNVRGARQGGDP